jgi:hypothetical protein
MNGIYGNPAFTLEGVLAAVEDALQAKNAQRRYEYLRTLNPQQFQELWTRNLNGKGGFDDLVDAAMQSRLLKVALGACQWPACAVHHPCERRCQTAK